MSNPGPTGENGTAPAESPSSESIPAPAASPPATQQLTFLLYPLLLLVVAFFYTVRPISDTECWGSLGYGRFIVQTGSLPRTDAFSFTAAGQPCVPYGWLSCLVMHLLMEVFGPNGAGLLGWTFAAVAIAYMMVYLVARLRYGDQGSILPVLLVAMLFSHVQFQPRPEVWQAAFLGAIALILVTSEQSDRQKMPMSLWFLPLLMAAWSNLNFGFTAALPLLVIYAIWMVVQYIRTAQRWRLMALVPTVLSMAAWLINPYGWRAGVLSWKEFLPIGRLDAWVPIVGGSASNLPAPLYIAYAAVLCFALFVVIRGGRSVPVWHTVCLCFYGFLPLVQRTHLDLAGIVVPIFLLPHLGQLGLNVTRHRIALPVTSTILAAALCTLQVLGISGMGAGWPRAGRNGFSLPCQLTFFLENFPPPSPIFNERSAGCYLAYNLAPKVRVFIDGRPDVYSPAIRKDYAAFFRGQESVDDLAAKYAVGTFVLDITDAFEYADHPAHGLSKRKDFELVYYDDRYGVFVRKERASDDYVAQLGFRYASPFNPQRLVDIQSNTSARDAATSEIQRALYFSGGSANACSLAALALHEEGSLAEARRMLAIAFDRNPASVVVARIAKAITGPSAPRPAAAGDTRAVPAP